MDKFNAFGNGVVKTVAAGIGFASESVNSYKEKKLEEYSSDKGSVGKAVRMLRPPPPQQQNPYFETNNSKTWALDDAQEKEAPVAAPAKTKKEIKERDTNKIIASYFRRHPAPEQKDGKYPIIQKLPLPVILPQKRPKDRSRGFVKAYAPVLKHSGIDQATFLDFLETFEQGIRASPWLEAINLVSLAALSLPIPEAIAIDIACMVVIETATSVQTRTRGNDLLSKFNEEFFQPRGLFGLLMTSKAENASKGEEELAISSIVSRARISLYEDKVAQRARNLRRSDGSTNTIPEAAPLIFPGLDELSQKTDEKSKKKKDSLTSASEFVNNYLDKRAGVKHPDSTLTQPKPVFKSRYADPTHPAASGNFRALLTGGKSVTQLPKDEEKRKIGDARADTDEPHKEKNLDNLVSQDVSSDENAKKPEAAEERTGSEDSVRSSDGNLVAPGAKQGGIMTPVKKAIKSNVMYLLIVNMPTEEEMAAAQAAIAKAGKGQMHDAWERCWL
ncbi:hypothetical protein BKA64DRAFT_742453 [Cadophora sp. MPI-SDFR-AT-0126]|nr:hypothetical protein BKA64DRAFT_742453 [Leotiomycetes sp. MPI-SDFR-AT-0126]